MATKNKILILITTIATIYGVVALGFNFTVAQEPRSIDVSAYIVNSQNEAVPNGEYDVRFAFYTIDREISDPYPSDTDAGRKIWEETQKVYVHDGILNAYLGTVVPFPESITFHGSTLSNYYLGIRIGTDSEMVPRKRVGSVPSAINSYFLRGATLGTREGDIIQLGKGGKINIKQLPTGTGSSNIVLGNDSRLHNKVTLSGSYNYLTLSSQKITLNQIDLSTDVTETLDIGNGGTGSTGFTAGSVIFSNGAILTQDNANFFWNDTNNYLGIGTTSPNERLDINGTNPRVYLADATAPGTTTNRLYSVSGNLTWNGINLTGGGALPSGTEGQMLYNNAGSWTAFSGIYWDDANNWLGIGTTSPLAKLTVEGDLITTGRISAGNDAMGRETDDWGNALSFDFSQTLTDFSTYKYWAPLNSTIKVDPTIDLTGADYGGATGAYFETQIPYGNTKNIGHVGALHAAAFHFGSGTLGYLTSGTIWNISDGGGNIGEMTGLFIESNIVNASNLGSITNNYGVDVYVSTNGTVTNNYGIRIGGGAYQAGSVVSNDYGLYISSPYANGSIDTHYGLYLADQAFGTTSYAIYSAGGQSYFAGNVGIGTTAPRTRLELGNDGAILAIGTYDSGWTEPDLGTGTRLLWYPKKAAFRAGYVDGTQWNDDNIGGFSTAMGYNTTASSWVDTAMGGGTTASGGYSTAMGYNTTASGSVSTAMGYYTIASGDYSTAMGYNTTASGDYSIVIGQGDVNDTYQLINNIASSLMIGFNSNIPTLFVGPSSGTGTTGDVGIGTNSPSNKLHVQGTDTGSAGIYLNDATPGTTTTTLYNDNGNLYWGTTNLSGGGALPSGTEGQMLYNNAGAWTAFSGMYWDDTNSRLGIGTTSPGSKLTVSGDIQGDGLLIGNAVDPSHSLYNDQNQIMHTVTEPIGDWYYDLLGIIATANFTITQPTISFNAADIVAETDPTYSGALSQLTGVISSANHWGSGNIGEIKGSFNAVHNKGTGIITYAEGGMFVYANTGAGSITNAYGIYIESPSNDTSNNNITNAYGLYIQEQNRGTNKWNIYSIDGRNYFGGNVGIGTTGPTSILHTIASGAKTADYIGNLLTNTATSSTASITKTGLSVTSTGTWDGTSAVNRGLYVNATGGTTNYSAIFEGGNVGIGTTSPSQKLHVVNNSGNAIWGEGSSTGVYGSTTSWAGVQGEANGSGTPFVGYLTYASTNTPEILMRLDRRSSNTPAVGMGGFIGFYSQDASSNYESAADIGFLMTNVTHGSEASDIFFKTRSGGGNPSEKMRITGTGSVGIGTTSPSYALDIKARSTVGDETFTGSGLDDMDSGGTFIGSSALNYRIQIDGTGTPDTFKWSDDGGSTWDATLVAITGSAQTLNNGVTVTFGATTGHTSDDRWDFSTTVTNPLAIQNAAGTRSLYVGNDGLVGIGTTSPGAKLDITGTSNATQFIVRANATQSNSNPLIKAFDSSGNELLRIHSDNSYNLFFGKGAGNANNISGVGTEGLYNSFFGGQAGQSNTTGQANTAFGSAALRDNTTGYGNTAFGRSVLIGLNGGNSNTVFGAGAGGSLTTGSGNILIGENVDAPTATTDNFLNIGNTIYGNLSTGKVGIGTASFGTNNKFLVNPYNTVDNLATAQISTTVATNKGLVIQGFTSQSANLQEWQSSVGTAVSYINAAGDFVHGNFTLGTNSISMSGYPTYFQWGNGQKLEDNGGGGLRMSSLYALDIEADTDNDGTNGIAGNSYINFKTRSTSRLFVDNNGYIGIGNTSPSQGLEVGSTTNGLNAKITAAIGVTNLITNGTFVSDLSSWTPSGGWAWSAGTAKNDGTGGYLTQQFSKTVGKQYKITFDVVGGTAGKLYIGQGANTFEKDPGSASYTEQFKALTDQELYFYSQGFDGAVDNVVIYELTNGNLAVDGDITLSGSITGNSATIGMVPATNGNFGFGTYYARDKVTVNGNIRTQGGSIFLGGDDEVTGIGTVTSTGQLKIFDYQIIRFGFMSSGSFDEKFTMTPTGLGIGTTSPSNKLHVQGTDTGSAGIYLNDATPGTTTTTLYNDGGDLYWGTTNLSSSGTSLWETGAYGTYEDDDDVIVGTAGDETLANTGFVLGGDDLFVAGMAGVEGNIYTDGSFIAGSTTTYGNGSITLSTGTDLNIDSNTLYIDNANNRIGIGTSSPSEQLAIRSNSYFDTVYFYNGSSYTDDTTESRTSGGTAFWVLSSTSHYFYTGKDSTFTTIYLDFAVAGAGVTRSVQYWNGSTWTALTHTDGTSNLSTDGAITFTAPGDWAQTAVNGTTRYWVRISTTSMPTAGITAYFTVPDSTTRLGIYEYGDSSPAFSIGKNWNLNIPTGATYQMAGTNVLRISGAVSSFFAGPNAGRVNTESGTQNVFVGVDAGYTNTSGTDNVFVGRSAGYNNTTGAANVFVGWQAGFTNSNATGSTYVGDYAGQSSNAVDNTMVGKWAGQSNTNGGYNTYLGSQAGRNGTSNINYSTIIGYAAGNSNTGSMNLMVGAQAGMSNTGSYNVFLGNSAGTSTTGSYNAFLGYQAGQANTGGDYGTFLGYQAGITNTSGDYNTFIGYRAGNNNSTGASNVFLGYQAGFSETGSNKLYIANTNTAAPLILGDFNASVGSGLTASITGITINANGTSSTASLTKTGLDIEATGTWNGTSAVNRALYATATGGTNNYAAIFDQGSVGIGTTSPGTKMEVVTVSSGDGIRIKNGGVSVLSLYSTYADSSNRNWGIMTSYDNFGDFALRGSNAQNGDPFGAGTTMFVINKNGSVGIGTTAPGAKLDVLYGESATTAGSYYGMRSDTNSTGIFTTGTTYMYGMYGDAASTGVSTGGTVNTYGGYFTATGENTGAATTNAYGLYVNGATGADNNYSAVFMNGSVGIGTTGPSEKLEVSGNVLLSGGSDRTISVGGSGTYDLTIQGSAYGATGPGGDINIIGGSGLSGGDIYINGGNGGTGVGDVILANDRGNVGIGTASPSAKLDLLYGESATTAGTYRGIRSDINSTGVFTTGFPTIVGVYGDASATGVSTGGTVRTVGGYFVAAGENTGAATTRAYGIYVDGASGADSNYSAAFLNGNVGIGTNAPGYLLTVEGEPGAAGYTHFTSYSDARLKENVVVLGEGYLDKIMQLKPSTFNYNSLTGYDEATRQRRITGFIAQELQTVFPEMVGHTEINGTDYLDTNLSALPLYIVKAMQEQQVQIGDLDTEDQRISTNIETLALKTDESVTNLAELQTSVDEQLAIIGEQLTTNNQQLTTLNSRVSNLEAGIMDQESRIVTLENLVATLQTQIDELKALTNQELNVAQIEANKNDIDYLKLLLGIDRTTNPGDVNILGKVEAEGVVAGAFTVKVSDEEKKTIGSNYIQAIEKDADGDGKDDVTGSDGKSYAVKTKAVSETCKIFTSFEDNPNGYNWVEKVKNDDGEYIGFKMVLSDPVAKDIYFNWWIVESAELGSGN